MKYQVYYQKVFTLNIGVEAKNEDEAKEKAELKLNKMSRNQFIERADESSVELTYADEE